MDEMAIYGASDDLIEIEGPRFVEEFNVGWPGTRWKLAVSDGTILDVEYGAEGIWRFRVDVVGSSEVSINTCSGKGERYTDIVTLTGENLTWVALATQIAR